LTILPSARAERIALGVTLGVIVLLGALVAVAALRYRTVPEGSAAPATSLGGVRHHQMAQGNRPVRRHVTPAPPTSSQPPAQPETPAIAVNQPAAPERAAPVARPVPAVRVLAARGDSWAEVRKGSETGGVLYAGIIVEGDSRTFRNRRLWIRFGAPENVDASIGGKPAALPSGTLNMLVTSRGFIAAA